MGYCDLQGTSDDTFDALFTRLTAVAALPAMAVARPAAARPVISCASPRR